jgi:predicted LPLAT superfamily acyltransferase
LFAIRTFGVKSAYLLLRFVSFYYVLFAKKQRQYIIDFYTGALHFGRSEAAQLSRRNFYVFGQTLIDRAAFLVGKGRRFTNTFENEQYLIDMQQGGKGGILLSAHIGNWETAGNMLKERVSSVINVIMLEAEVENIKKYMDKSTGGSLFNIIPIKNDLSHIFKINNALEKNELIAMHADRYVEGMRYLEISFLGRPARFPLGPFIIAAKFNAPVSFVYAIKASDNHYALSATLPVNRKMKPEEIATLYVTELEKKVKANPEQWFNYYNFYA